MNGLTRVDQYRLRLEPGEKRLIGATLYLSEGMQIEAEALRQLADVTKIEEEAIALATPDIHVGFGVPIGAVWASRRFISPAAVGYDINCGMRLLATPFVAAEVDIVGLAQAIYRDIPLGEGKDNVTVSAESLRQLLEGGVPALSRVAKQKETRLRSIIDEDMLAADLARIEDGGAMNGQIAAVPAKAIERGRTQLGTLGGGNHFIELQRVEKIDDEKLAAAWGLFAGQLVLMIHSGSRGLGHEIGGHYMRLAKEYCQRRKIYTPSKELAYMELESQEGKDYWGAMAAAANYAFLNRQIMAQLVRRKLREFFGRPVGAPTVYDVPHNMAKMETHQGRQYCVHRKGATRAYSSKMMARIAGNTPFAVTGQPVLIPGSMGTSSYLLAGVEGRAAQEAIYSVNHGAGRVMSRTAAAGVVRRGRVLRPGVISDRIRSAKDL